MVVVSDKHLVQHNIALWIEGLIWSPNSCLANNAVPNRPNAMMLPAIN